MKSPIVFQSLEHELAPVTKYIHGRVLNAGCGARDISKFLVSHGAESVENCDLKTAIPNAIIADLSSVPRPSGTYDTIICNAVLEHAEFPNKVMQELRRLLTPTGHLILGVPFIQPYHPAPDFRRYSREGMEQLGRQHDFETVVLYPVHTIAQTITWVWWSYLQEKRKRFWLAVLWLPFYLWNRMSPGNDLELYNQANSYQIVLTKSSANGNHAHCL
jgi:SAM-dependent methyltransferase